MRADADERINFLCSKHEKEKSELVGTVRRLEYELRGDKPTHERAANLLIKARLSELPLFGEPCPADQINFRWPTVAHLANLDQFVYPRL